MHRVFALAACVLVFFATVSAAPHPDAIPIHVTKDIILVNIVIGETPVHMILDTGASKTVIPMDIALPLIASHDILLSGNSDDVSIADGSQIQVRNVTIPTLALGHRQMHDVAAWLLPGASQGLLGLSVLRRLSPFTIDMGAGYMFGAEP